MRSLSLIQLTFISVCLFSGSLQAQTFPTSGNQYIWKVGDGTYSDWSTNYSYNGGSTTSAPNALRDVIFGWEGTPTTARISLAPGVSTGSARSYNIYNGDFTFDFNGNTTTVWNKIWRFGNGSDSTTTVHFTGPSGSAIQFTELVIGDNGSSSNVFGGPDGTITFGSNVTYSFSSNGKLTVGSTQGGGGNVFNVLAGQDISRGVILVNAGVGNKIVIQDGGTLAATSTASSGMIIGEGASLIVTGTGSQFNKTGTAQFDIFGEVIVKDGASLTNSAGLLNITSGAKVLIDGGTLDSSGSTNIDLAGELTIIHGGDFKTTTGLRILGSNTVIRIEDNIETGPLDMNVDGSGNTTSKLTLKGGGELYAQGLLNIRKGSQGYSEGETLIEAQDGSVLRVDTLYIDARGQDNYIPIQGKVIVGSGGFSVTSNKSDDKAVLTVGAGTHLQLEGDTYGLAYGTNADGGRLYVESGGTLSGYGTLRAGLNLEGGRLLVGDGVEPRLFAVGTLSNANSFTDASFSFNLFDEFGSSDQLQSLYSISFQGTQTLSVNFLGDASALDAEFTTYQLFLNSSGDSLNVGSFNYDFSESSPILTAAGLAWNTTDFSSTGTLKLAEVAALSFIPQDGESLGHSSTLTVVNDSTTKSAKILEARTSNSSWTVTGLADGTNLAAGGSANAAATTQFVDQELALNGTHKATLTVQVDHDLSNANPDIHDIVTHRWDLSETVSDQVAAYGVGGRTETYLAHVDEENRYEGFGLTSEDGTMATFLSGQATTPVTLQMSFDHTTGSFLGGSSSGPTFLSDVVNVEVLDSTTLEAMTNPFVLNLQFTGDYNDGDALWLGYSSVFDSTGSFDLVDWANVGMDEYYVGSYESYLSDYGSDLLPGVWGFDETTKSIWAVVNQSGSYAAFSGGIVPEPSRVTLLAAGLALLIFRRKRKTGTC